MTQEREIKIAATSPDSAIMIAAEAFDRNSSSGLTHAEGRPASGINTKAISARED